jgi:hypothetical protein
MTIRLTKEPVDFANRGDPAEHCCFCFSETRTWCKRKDVAVCEWCAESKNLSDVPSKEVWCAEVRARFPRLAVTP